MQLKLKKNCLSSAPTPPQSRAINEIKRLLSRATPDFQTAETHISRAIGGNVACIELVHNAVKRPGITEKQKLDFLQEVVPDADRAIQRLYGDDCFEPSSNVYGHFWRLVETRGYVRLLLDVVFASADCGEYRTSVVFSKRILEMNHGDNNGSPPLPSPSLSPPFLMSFLQAFVTGSRCL